MSAIPRKQQKVFGSGLTPSGNVGNFGSLAAATPTYSNDPDTIQTARWLTGISSALVGNRSLSWQDLNGVLLVLTQQIAYLMQSGIPEWLTSDIYFTNDFARVGGSVYVSLTDNNTGNNPATDATNWIPLTSQMKGPAVCRAWVEFDGINQSGGNSIIHSSFNVDRVVKNADGSYTIVFTDPMPTSHYAFAGSCGSEDGQPYGAGDNGLVVGNVAGQGNAIRSATQCRVFTINPNTLALVASGDVSVQFFG